MASSLFWHVPFWFQGGFGTATGVGNVGQHMVVELVETESASATIAPDNYWVERVVGQYMVTSLANPLLFNPLLHHRMYVTEADSTSTNLRDLASQDDADTSFMMHKVEAFDAAWSGGQFGNWNASNYSKDTYTMPISRSGGFDVKVGRKVSEGESLIWHTQIEGNPSGPPNNDQFFLKMWTRVLLKQL